MRCVFWESTEKEGFYGDKNSILLKTFLIIGASMALGKTEAKLNTSSVFHGI